MKHSKETAEHYTWGASCDGWHLLKSDSLSVIEERMPPGTSEQLHCHEFAQQVFYILSGTATFEIAGKTEIIRPGESIYIPKRTLHCIANREPTDLCFLVISEPKAQGDRIEVLDYSEELKEHIKRLNVEWLEKYFHVEPIDIVQLSHPKEEILDKDGMIFYVRYKGEIVGTASLLKINDTTYELGKMAVTETCQGHGIGNILMEHCIAKAIQAGATELELYSNTKLGPAIHLYEKYGFTEIPMPAEQHYERSDIRMVKIL